MTIDIKSPAVRFESGLTNPSTDYGSDKQETTTVVTFGVPRGGTTMVAGIVQRCGVNIGVGLPDNLEDPDFTKRDLNKLRAAIRSRNQQYSLWGWKFPRAATYLLDIQEELVNPKYLVVWRDPLAISFRGFRRGEVPHEILTRIVNIQKQNIDVMKKLKGAVLNISYERAVKEPQRTAGMIADFIGADRINDEGELREFVKPGAYKPIEI